MFYPSVADAADAACDPCLRQNPFGAVYRDADLETMTDGWDNATAHGWLDPLGMAAHPS